MIFYSVSMCIWQTLLSLFIYVFILVKSAGPMIVFYLLG